MENIPISILHVGVFSGMNFNNLLYKILMDCIIVLNIIDNNVEIITFFNFKAAGRTVFSQIRIFVKLFKNA